MRALLYSIFILLFISCNNSAEEKVAEEEEIENISDEEVRLTPDFENNFPQLNLFLKEADSSLPVRIWKLAGLT